MTLYRRGETSGVREVKAGRISKEEREAANQAMLVHMADKTLPVLHKCDMSDKDVRTVERLIRAGLAYSLQTYKWSQKTTVYYLSRQGCKLMKVSYMGEPIEG